MEFLFNVCTALEGMGTISQMLMPSQGRCVLSLSSTEEAEKGNEAETRILMALHSCNFDSAIEHFQSHPLVLRGSNVTVARPSPEDEQKIIEEWVSREGCHRYWLS